MKLVSVMFVCLILSLASFTYIITYNNANAQLFFGSNQKQNQNQNQINQANEQQTIQQQIQALQNHLKAIQIQKEQAAKAAIARLIGPVVQRDNMDHCATDQHTPDTWKSYLTDFRCGHVTVFQNGTVLRKFLLIADDFHGTGKPIAITKNATDPLIFHAWTFNGSVPGPTMRMTEGDHVQITVVNSKDSSFIHSYHMHSIHSGAMDGVMGQGGMIFPGTNYTYSFVASPPGVYPYHCHMAPVEEHVSRGLYGMVIIDPKTPRSNAAEMVMMLNSYSFSYEGLNGSGHLTQTVIPTMQDMRKNFTDALESTDEANGPDNQVYTVNGMAFGYTGKDDIHLFTGVPYRIYLANMVEFDPINNFHLHGNMFWWQESGSLNSSRVYTDIVGLMQGDRGVIQFRYNQPGEFMFHSHLNHFSDLGWVGFFIVSKPNHAPPPA